MVPTLSTTTMADFVQDTMTEEQRMEEGRRMFQIFAARMFEQRVLTAYKEKGRRRTARKTNSRTRRGEYGCCTKES